MALETDHQMLKKISEDEKNICYGNISRLEDEKDAVKRETFLKDIRTKEILILKGTAENLAANLTKMNEKLQLQVSDVQKQLNVERVKVNTIITTALDFKDLIDKHTDKQEGCGNKVF